MSFSHLNSEGGLQMVDVGHKPASTRQASAQAKVVFPADAYHTLCLMDGKTKKGSVTDVAHLAGIMAAKQTANLIPLCHTLPLDKVGLTFNFVDEAYTLIIEAHCKVTHKTGVEMEALTAVSIAALTVYDMCKALSHQIKIEQIGLLSKSGGKQTF